jgi:outer membrane beta-barrel protein
MMERRIHAIVLVMAMLGLPAAASGQAFDPTRAEGWEEARHAKVIQGRLYEKLGRHSLSIFGGVIPNDEMSWVFPLGARHSWFLSETMALEWGGTYCFDTPTSLANRLGPEDRRRLQNPRETLRWSATAAFLWYPFYGKFALLGSTLAHFDIGLRGGLGAVGIEKREIVGQVENYANKVKVAGQVGLVGMLYLSRYFALRMDLDALLYPASGKNVKVPFEILVGACLILPAMN